MTIGEKIKARREELNMSQEELAKRVGYASRSSIQKIETSRDLPLKKVKQIAQALAINPSYLMGWTEEQELPIYMQHIDFTYKSEFDAYIETLDEIQKSKLLAVAKAMFGGE